MYRDIGGGHEIIQAGKSSYKIFLPKKPPNNQIIGYNLKRKDQKWKRFKLPEYWDERRDEEKYRQDQEDLLVKEGKLKKVTYFDPILEKFRREEWHRRFFGVWVFINGVATYITGPNHWYLSWCKLDHEENDGYPLYYDSQRKRFYFRQLCYEDPHCLGYIIVGPRGFGKSSEEAGAILENMTRPPHRRVAAIQSKSYEDAQQVIFKEKFVPIYQNLPDFYQPVSSHGTNPEKKMTFTRYAKRSEKNTKRIKYSPDLELHNIIYPVSAKEKALDGRTLSDILNDEIGKTDPKKEADVYKRMHVNRFCVYRNHRKRGLIRSTTTVEYMDEGGEECYLVWTSSDPEHRTENGFTISGLYKYFQSSIDTTTQFADDFGMVDEDKARRYHANELESRKNNMIEYNSYLRKNCRNEDEAFIKDASKCIFNVEILTKRLEVLNNMRHPPYVRGNFFWKDQKDGKVDFEQDNQAGRFLVSRLLDRPDGELEGHKRQSNRISVEVDHEGKRHWYPMNDRYFGIGADPIKWNKTTDPRASKAAAIGFHKYDDAIDRDKDIYDWVSHCLVFQYLHRPDEFEVYGEDMIMACRYYGCSINPETNVTTLDQYFSLRGHERFLTRRRDFHETVLAGKKDDTGISSHPEVITNYVQRIQTFVNRHGHRIPFPQVITQLLNFNPADTTKYDLAVALGYVLLEIEKMIEDDSPIDNIDDWMDFFDNSGVKPTYGDEEAELVEQEENDPYF